MKHLLALIAVVALAACSGGHDKGTTPDHGGSGSGSGDGSAAGTGDGSATPVAAALTEDECRNMFGHIIDVSLAERRKKDPTKKDPTPEALAAAKDKSASEGMAECLKFPRDQYECIVAATDAATLGACGE